MRLLVAHRIMAVHRPPTNKRKAYLCAAKRRIGTLFFCWQVVLACFSKCFALSFCQKMLKVRMRDKPSCAKMYLFLVFKQESNRLPYSKCFALPRRMLRTTFILEDLNKLTLLKSKILKATVFLLVSFQKQKKYICVSLPCAISSTSLGWQRVFLIVSVRKTKEGLKSKIF